MRSNYQKDGSPRPLGEKETLILQMVAEGRGDKEIAAAVFMTPNSVTNCVKDIRIRLSAMSRSHAVALGLKKRLIHFPKKNGSPERKRILTVI